MNRVVIEVELNEPEARSFIRLINTLRGSHNADLVIRKGGKDHRFEADWLRRAVFTGVPEEAK